MTTIYVTKYALSSGVFTVDAEISSEGSMASWKTNGWTEFAHGKDFWLTEAEALADCERRRQNKIKSIEKQKAKLEKMTFTFDEVK